MCWNTLQYFVKKERLGTGWKLLMISGLSPGFLRMEVAAFNFSVCGTEPELKEELLVSLINEEMIR